MRAHADTRAQRKKRVNREGPLSITQQCRILDIPRSTVYRRPSCAPDADLEVMRLMDRCHMERPFYGSRRIVDWLADEGHRVNRKRVQRLMRKMGLVATYPRRRLSLADRAHRVYPYRLRNLTVNRPNPVWCADLTYIPMARGFVYLVAVMDWYSRKVLSWRLSNTMDSHFCVAALEEALEEHGIPESVNTEQGSQFTSEAFIEVL